MAHVNVAVGVRGAVVQNEFACAFAGLADGLIHAAFFPVGDPAGFALGEVSPHRKGCVRQIQRIFFRCCVSTFVGFCHVFLQAPSGSSGLTVKLQA